MTMSEIDSSPEVSSSSATTSIGNRFVDGIRGWLRDMPVWWSGLTVTQKLAPVLLIAAYWLSLIVLNGFRGDHLSTGVLILLLCYSGRFVRGVIFPFLLPFSLVGIIYDSQRFYSDYLRGRVRVDEPYLFDKAFFGISTAGGVLTPNEWLQLHLHPALDLITGFAYLVFVVAFIVCAAIFYFWYSRRGTAKVTAAEIAKRVPGMIWGFFWLNILGYSTYYWYPAAPPWYVTNYGLGPADMSAAANQAGCVRFDQLLGTSFFAEMYGRSADVFGAIPSLHVAYPLLAVFYAFRFGSLRIFSVVFYLLMCFSAVYLNHHYVLDVIWGSAYAIIIGVGFDAFYRRKTLTS
jgi:inositol phosphorylceramide synthase catalytic subunit